MAAKKINIVPLSDRVLVRPLDSGDGTATSSGIIIPDTVSKEKSEQGVVIAVGEGRTTDEGKVIPIKVKVGDTVLYGKYGGTDLKLEGKDYLMMREADILAII